MDILIPTLTLIKRIGRVFGVDLRLYAPESSDDARMMRILSYHNIDLVFDVGANTGQYAKYLRFLGYSGRIVSFEPLSSAYAQLITAAKKDRLWEVAPRAALGSRDGEIKINVAENSVSSSALAMFDSHSNAVPASTYIDSETVPLYKLDTIAPRYMTDNTRSIYLKIDVQGLEIQVLEGALTVLPRVKGLQLELSLVPLYEGQPLFRDMLDKLNDLGYELYAVVPVFTDKNNGRLLQLDGIFFRT